MPTISLPTICLDVAIDHRIRRLCKPTLQQERPEPSEHISILQQHGAKLGRPTDEIRVTSQLAGPATTGGILITLKQPRYNHPFDKGIDAVIHDCETFRALEELFKVASCDTLTLQQHVSLIDLLPFTPQRVESVSIKSLKDSFEASRMAIYAKRPDVVLCAGRIWLPNEDRNSTARLESEEVIDLKGGLQKLETEGVGQPDRYGVVGLQGCGPELLATSRVNGFHPSYAVNYLPEHSNLRQLLLLNVVKTCGIYRGDWHEVRWMDTLRADCSELTNMLRDKKTSAEKAPVRGHLERVTSGRSRTLADYAQIYCTVQKDFLSTINRMKHSQAQTVENIYNDLLGSKISSKCNDVSVVLRRICELFKNGWSETESTATLQCLAEITLEVHLLADTFINKPLQVQNIRLKEIIEMGMINLSACFTHDGSELAFNIEMSADVFLQMALSIETMLGDLMENVLEAENQHCSTFVGVSRITNQGGNDCYQGQIIILD
ncbi:hypothetical protein F5Y12DRAFT_798346 [Xylaria sp. FL1777]|nr:hypothetical protein F5Y12DRAFT_798346 [Xylaria sp. FL1777]